MNDEIVEIPSELAIRALNVNAFLLTEEEAAAVLRVSRRTFQNLRTQAWMPPPIYLGPRLLRWSVDELRMALKDMPRGSKRNPQPDSLRAHREGGASQ